MGQLVVLGIDVLFDEKILVLTVAVQNDMRTLVGGAANVGPEHDGVGGVTAELFRVEGIAAREELDVGAATIDLLLVLDGVLDDEVLLGGAVEGGGEGGGEAVEARVLGGLDALVVGGAAVEGAGGVGPVA